MIYYFFKKSVVLEGRAATKRGSHRHVEVTLTGTLAGDGDDEPSAAPEIMFPASCVQDIA